MTKKEWDSLSEEAKELAIDMERAIRNGEITPNKLLDMLKDE